MNYIYNNYQVPELEELFEKQPSLKKYIMELRHTFNLYVYDVVQEEHMTVGRARLCNEKGVHIAEVWIGRGEDKDGNLMDSFCYYSNWFRKQRGRSETDRRTFSSIKLSSLISAMKRAEAIPSIDVTYNVLNDSLNTGEDNIRKAVSSSRGAKSSYDVDVNAYHAMLKILLNNESPDLLMRFDRSNLQKVLDEFNKVDEINALREADVKEKFLLPELYGIAVTHSGDYLVAKFSVDVIEKSRHDLRLKANVKDMKRVKSLLESHSEFIPLLTMYKAANDGKYEENRLMKNNDNWLIPRGDRYDKDFDINLCFDTRGHGRESIQWMFVPCSAI